MKNQLLQLILTAVGIASIFLCCGYVLFADIRQMGWRCDINIKPSSYIEPWEFEG